MISNRHKGFTLVELMIALVVAGILIQVVAPGFQKMIKDNRVRSEVYAIRAALNTARSEAITLRESVTLCAGTESGGCAGANANWADGFIAFVDRTGDSNYSTPTTAAEDQLVLAHLAKPSEIITIRLDNGGDSQLVYRPQGYTGAPASFEVCDDRELTDARGLLVSAIGYVSAATDTNDDGIQNDHGGDNFDCEDPPAPP